MDKLLIKSATLAFPGAEPDGREADVLISDGKINRIGTPGSISDADARRIEAAGTVLAPGFLDLNANFGEPGLETKEDILSGAHAAAAGGYTAVAVQPNTEPALHSRAEISLVVNRARGLLVDVYPLAAISRQREGKELAELYDMKLAGALAFTDGNRSVQQAGLMGRALLYSKGFDGLVMSFAEDQSVAGNGRVNEGEMSTLLGMKGNPNLAEELMVSRDLRLAAYNEARIHFSTISTAGSVSLIRAAKAEGIPVTCDVAAHHLVLTDTVLSSFDSNYKVKPPLRTEADRVALLEGLQDGTVDAVVSQHTPHETEYKAVEFETAAYGIIGLQTVLPLLLQAGLTPGQIAQVLAVNPRRIAGMPLPELKEGAAANMVLFNPKEKWTFDAATNRSKSANSPFFNTGLTGRVLLVVNNGQIYYG